MVRPGQRAENLLRGVSVFLARETQARFRHELRIDLIPVIVIKTHLSFRVSFSLVTVEHGTECQGSAIIDEPDRVVVEQPIVLGLLVCCLQLGEPEMKLPAVRLAADKGSNVFVGEEHPL